MKYYEILPLNFDGSTDEHDDQIRWIAAASSFEAGQYAIDNGLDPNSVVEIDPPLTETELD